MSFKSVLEPVITDDEKGEPDSVVTADRHPVVTGEPDRPVDDGESARPLNSVITGESKHAQYEYCYLIHDTQYCLCSAQCTLYS